MARKIIRIKNKKAYILYKIIKNWNDVMPIFKKFTSIFLVLSISLPLFSFDTPGEESFQTKAKTALLMEATTGTILYEKDADLEKAPASVTKIMTLLLIFEALEQNQYKLSDIVTVSEHAASMGGSQVFLEAGETQSVETLIKCIVISSANDASVAMAEYTCASEEAFVNKMNERAKALHMEHTHFDNCCGLDSDTHYTSAKDIAIMSRQLTLSHPEIFDYCGIWMDTITHVTKRGSSPFGLSNTNKLIRQYQGATGLKTGSTSKAGFCLSATATRNGISLIAVVMDCSSSKERISEASSLLDYGFSICHMYKDENPPSIPSLDIRGALMDTIPCKYDGEFSYISTTSIDSEKIERRFTFYQGLCAPIKKGTPLGELTYYYNNKKIGVLPIVTSASIPKATLLDYFKKLAFYF